MQQEKPKRQLVKIAAPNKEECQHNMQAIVSELASIAQYRMGKDHQPTEEFDALMMTHDTHRIQDGFQHVLESTFSIALAVGMPPQLLLQMLAQALSENNLPAELLAMQRQAPESVPAKA